MLEKKEVEFLKLTEIFSVGVVKYQRPNIFKSKIFKAY
jgi:hypothetical protein